MLSTSLRCKPRSGDAAGRITGATRPTGANSRLPDCRSGLVRRHIRAAHSRALFRARTPDSQASGTGEAAAETLGMTGSERRTPGDLAASFGGSEAPTRVSR